MAPIPLDAIESGQSILFLGAGFSRDAESQLNKKIFGAWELTEYLLKECGITETKDYDLESASEEYRLAHNDTALTDALYNNFVSTKITDAQRTVICQPWRRIYTSNYDDIVERVSHIDNKKVSVKEITDAVEPPVENSTQLVHIYGSIARISPQEFRRSFLLTEAQRDNSLFLTSPWLWRFNDDVLAAPAIFFCGFALRDIDLRRLLGRLPPQTKTKIYFIDAPAAPKPLVQRLDRFGQTLLIGVDGFAAELGRKRLSRSLTKTVTLPRSVEELTFHGRTETTVTPLDIDRFLVAGLFEPNLVSQRDLDGSPGSYSIKRSSASFDRATRLTPPRPVVVHGDIGNGKSVFACQVAYAYSIAGYRVFRLTTEPEDIGEIIAFFSDVKGKCLVLADDLSRFRSLVAKLIGLGRDDLRVLTTARSNFFEAGRAIVDTRLGHQSFVEIDLNLASADELHRIVQYFDENALFGTRAELDLPSRKRFIRENCGGQLRDVILSLFENGALHEKVLSLIESINELSQDVYNLTILSALLTTIGFEEYGRLFIIADLAKFNGTFEEAREAFENRGLLGLVRLEQGDLSFRSPAFAQFLLRRSAGVSRVLSVAKTALFQLDAAYSDDPHFDALTRSLLKISVYGNLFKNVDIELEMDKLYNDCRVLRIAKRDPLFLIQRSITNMNLGNYDVSGKYVETAYGMAKAIPGYNTYQIDTHNAKLLLTISLRDGVSSEANREVRALSLLEMVLDRRSDDLYHPLSVLRLLGDITRKFGPVLQPAERRGLRRVLDRAVSRLVSLPHHLRTRFGNLRNIEQSLKEAQAKLV